MPVTSTPEKPFAAVLRITTKSGTKEIPTDDYRSVFGEQFLWPGGYRGGDFPSDRHTVKPIAFADIKELVIVPQQANS